MEDYSRRRHEEAGYEFVYSPHITKGAAVRDLRATSTGTPTACTRRCTSTRSATRRQRAQAGAGLLPQADELPDALPDLPVAGAVLPRAAAAAVRVRLGLPLREVRRRPRPDPGARHDPGRRAHLLHPRADAGRARRSLLTFVLDLLKDYGLDDFYLELSTKDPRQVRRRPTRSGTRPPETLRGGRRPTPASSWCPTRAAPRSTARRSPCRRATRSAAPGRCRRSSSTSTCPSGSSWSTPRADGSRQRPVMIHRALFGSIERFVGVLVEHYAGAFPPWLAPVQVVGDPDRRAAQRLPAGGGRAAAGARASGSRSTSPTTGCRRRSATRSCRRCRSC